MFVVVVFLLALSLAIADIASRASLGPARDILDDCPPLERMPMMVARFLPDDFAVAGGLTVKGVNGR